jgi:hypothetical protein
LLLCKIPAQFPPDKSEPLVTNNPGFNKPLTDSDACQSLSIIALVDSFQDHSNSVNNNLIQTNTKNCLFI